MALSAQQQAAKAEYQKQREERAKVTAEALKATETAPTPTQEENDLLRLGLMHPDEKVDPNAAKEPAPRATATTGTSTSKS